MKLKYCSITGADDQVDPKSLCDISKKYPFVEWAVLLLPSQSGKARFPTKLWIKEFSSVHKNNNIAMHLCEESLLDFIADNEKILTLMSNFKRIQLNLKFGNIEGKYDPLTLASQVKKYSQWEFIIQYSKNKKNDLLDLFVDIPNHSVLFDESAGRGINPGGWEKPIKGHFCGYAGGLNPDNLSSNLEIISIAAADHITWIDMETGVRTNDRFDLHKVEQILKIASNYVA